MTEEYYDEPPPMAHPDSYWWKLSKKWDKMSSQEKFNILEKVYWKYVTTERYDDRANYDSLADFIAEIIDLGDLVTIETKHQVWVAGLFKEVKA